MNIFTCTSCDAEFELTLGIVSFCPDCGVYSEDDEDTLLAWLELQVDDDDGECVPQQNLTQD